MNLQSYTEAGEFLDNCQDELESSEAANSLLLGISMNLDWFPKRVDNLPCLTTITEEHRLVLAAIMTPPHNLVLSTHQGNLEAACQLLVDDLIKRGWAVPGVLAPSPAAEAFARHWLEATGRRFKIDRQQRVFELRETHFLPSIAGKLRIANPADLDLVATWENGFNVDIFRISDLVQSRQSAELRIGEGDLYLWDDQQPRSMAMKTRPTRHGISISQVYTPPEFRGRGYATACVAELSRGLLHSGWQFCALFAVVTNQSANYVYQKIGYKPVCNFDEITFV